MNHGTRFGPIFRQIYQENIVPIQEYISVDFDNRRQTPLGFSFLGRYYEVSELIGVYPDHSNSAIVTFLVRTRYGVYALYLDAPTFDPLERVQSPVGSWVLHYYVEEDSEPGEVDMLVEMSLKQVADFHGHLCPDLVIGYRAARYALSRLEIKFALPNLRVMVENNASGLDALQLLTGCTPGNLRLHIRDQGKHIYTFLVDNQHGLCLTLTQAGQQLPIDMLNLEDKIQSGTATLEEVTTYQHLLDQRIIQLLKLSPEALFDIQWVEMAWPEAPLSSAIENCDGCGEPVMQAYLFTAQDRRLCRRCFEARKTIPKN